MGAGPGRLQDPAVTEYHGSSNGHGPRSPVITWDACHPVSPQAALNGSGTFDSADMMGPHDPYWWDLRKFAAWGFLPRGL
jgi:hypothetical protein